VKLALIVVGVWVVFAALWAVALAKAAARGDRITRRISRRQLLKNPDLDETDGKAA
jgi:uncharacterized protein YneF (UPF0154 family)